MIDSSELLRFRVLVNFYFSGGENCTVTGLSRTLCEEKYVISRCLMNLEKEGYLDRSNKRQPVLTNKGLREAKNLSDRMEIAVNHLMYEGVDMEHARQDATVWAIHNTEETMKVIRNTDEKYRIKRELRNKKDFWGSDLSKKYRDGIYRIPFIIYREKVHNGDNISMANRGFEHPCTLKIDNGNGYVQLHAIQITGKSAFTGSIMKGKIQNLKYMENGMFIDAETDGITYSIPMTAIHFITIGTGFESVLHGSVCLKMKCSVGAIHMPESMAIFTLIL